MINEEDDPGDDLNYWICKICPMDPKTEENCKCHPAAIEGAKLFSFESEERCKLFVANHLFYGKCHPSIKSWEDAEVLSEQADIEVGVQTYEEREKKRQTWKVHAEDRKRIG